MALLQVTAERPDEQIAKLLSGVVQQASQEFSPLRYEGEYPDSGFGISELRAKQLGLGNNYWQMSVTTAFANWINKTLGTDVFIVITGLFNNSVDPAVTEIFPSANGKDLPYVNIEQLYSTSMVAKAWFSKPFAVRPSNNITIQAIGKVAQTELLGLLGYAVAKRSYLINAAP